MVHTTSLPVTLALLSSLTLTVLANPFGNDPLAPRSKCEPATLCVDGLQTCVDKTTTSYVRWGDCYDTCTATLTRPTCPTPFTDATDATSTPDPNSSPEPTTTSTTSLTDPADTRTKDHQHHTTTAPQWTWTKGIGGSTWTGHWPTKTKTGDDKAAASTGTVRVPAAAWKRVEERAKQWFGRGVLHLLRDALRGAAA